MIQITVIKITGYGPWTLTLGSDREHEIQMLQASLYLQIQKLFSEKNGLVFSNRSDEFFAITSCITLEDHIEIQKKLESSFDLKLSTTCRRFALSCNFEWFSKKIRSRIHA